jgi:hypothetical protein
MTYIVGQQFHGDVGELDSRLLGSVEANTTDEARKMAELRWPDFELCIHPLPSGPCTSEAAPAKL